MTERARRRLVAAAAGLAVTGLLAAGCGDDGSTSSAQGGERSTTTTEPVIDPGDGGHYDPHIDPADFVAGVDNPYLPFAPGMRWTYEGATDEGTEQTEVAVTDEHREVMGIPVVVVRDTVSLDGAVIEDTHDWYAQDRDGNVWYLGEDTAEYENGEVTSTEGSWEAGVDGALPGIVMPAHPETGHAYRQEFFPGHAEDLAEITDVGATKSTPHDDYDRVVVTKEWNPLEPDVVEAKHYAPGVGLIAEADVSGGHETAELTGFTGGAPA
jgi:hypothetical protein